MSRRLNFLSAILKEDEDSLLFKFLQAQLRKPSKNDWGQTVIKDLEILEIDMPLSEIASISSDAFKKEVNERIGKEALKYLNNEKSKHSKVLHIPHSEMHLQDYLSPSEMSVKEAKFLFQLRCRMIDVRANYAGGFADLSCPLCKVEVDSQRHLMYCKKLDGESDLVSEMPNYEDLFGTDITNKICVARIINQRFLKRKQMVKKEERKTPKGPSDPDACGL